MNSVFKSILTSSVAFALQTNAAPMSSGTVYESAGQKFRVETLGEYNDVVWGFDFLPDQRIILTGRDTGTVAVLDPSSGQFMSIGGGPRPVSASQGGMLDVRVSPEASGQTLIYLTYTTRSPAGLIGTALGMGALNGNNLRNYRQIFAVDPGVRGGNQFGSRLEFDGSGHIFMTIGDHGNRDLAQQLDSHIGKVLRLNLDGSAPADNPYVGDARAKKEIWSLGHRSPEGLAINPATGDIWETEMGPLGGDELNLIKRGANYGWPVICWGREYSGEPVGDGLHEKEGMEQPMAYWLYTEEKHNLTPAGLAFYNGDKFPNWRGNAFIGTLATSHLQRVILNGDQVIEQEELLGDLDERIRNVRTGPDGYLYFSTDNGLIARLVPVN